MIYADFIVPVYMPGDLSMYKEEHVEPYMFDRPDRFVLYRHQSLPHLLLKDDYDAWYMAIQWKLAELSEAKKVRQIYRPSYMDINVPLKLAEYIQTAELTVQLTDFDKSWIHLSVFVEQLSQLPAAKQLQIANADGNDDPAVVPYIHFIENEYEGERTRFLTGFETRSIATVSENAFYFKEIHLKQVSLLYLQYFVYFQQHGIIPSNQMMARLLGNLWASSQMMNNNWNASLFSMEKI